MSIQISYRETKQTANKRNQFNEVLRLRKNLMNQRFAVAFEFVHSGRGQASSQGRTELSK